MNRIIKKSYMFGYDIIFYSDICFVFRKEYMLKTLISMKSGMIVSDSTY